MLTRTILTFASFGLLAGCHNRDIEPAKLADLIKKADKIVVFESPMKNAKVIFTSTAPKDIAEFNEALTVTPPKDLGNCACPGMPAVRLYRGEKELVLVSNHHGVFVRCSLWASDALIKDPEKWLQWFDVRKIPEPRKEFDDMAASAKQFEGSYARWLSAMPKSFRPLVDQFPANIRLLRNALAKELPDIRQRALALFTWFGSGDGPWSGFPSYESDAELLLLDIPTPDLIAAAQTENLTEAQLEGASRLFGAGNFSERRPDDSKTLPAALKRKLLDHSLKSTNEDKLRKAKNAFAQP